MYVYIYILGLICIQYLKNKLPKQNMTCKSITFSEYSKKYRCNGVEEPILLYRSPPQTGCLECFIPRSQYRRTSTTFCSPKLLQLGTCYTFASHVSQCIAIVPRDCHIQMKKKIHPRKTNGWNPKIGGL